MPDAISLAEKKLRQAEFFVHHLAAVRQPERTQETMEFYFSATLSAAQSAFYSLDHHVGPSFNREHSRWRQTRTQDERAFLNRMIGLRDDDVHKGNTDATSLMKFMDARRFGQVHVFGFDADALVRETNPDGTTVSGPALVTVPALYIDHAGRTIEATKACADFIALLRDLVEHMKHVTTGSPEAST